MEIAQLGSALLGRLPEATALEPVKLPLILSGVCSLSSANYFPNPFGIFFDQIPFFAISKMAKNHFFKMGRSLKLPKMQFHEKNFELFEFTS